MNRSQRLVSKLPVLDQRVTVMPMTLEGLDILFAAAWPATAQGANAEVVRFHKIAGQRLKAYNWDSAERHSPHAWEPLLCGL
jgi:hypothetical protein